MSVCTGTVASGEQILRRRAARRDAFVRAKETGDTYVFDDVLLAPEDWLLFRLETLQRTYFQLLDSRFRAENWWFVIIVLLAVEVVYLAIATSVLGVIE
jgi:hypothetical protein